MRLLSSPTWSVEQLPLPFASRAQTADLDDRSRFRDGSSAQFSSDGTHRDVSLHPLQRSQKLTRLNIMSRSGCEHLPFEALRTAPRLSPRTNNFFLQLPRSFTTSRTTASKPRASLM